MLIVEVKNGKIEKALKVLKNKVRNVGQNQELRDRQQFVKDSTKDRAKKQAAVYKQKKKNLDD